MYSCIGNAKFEIYEETKITAEEKLMKISVFKEKKETKYLWVMLLNLEMNNKEAELISTMKGSQIIPVEQIELECKC